jgi:hypothetical protein
LSTQCVFLAASVMLNFAGYMTGLTLAAFIAHSFRDHSRHGVILVLLLRKAVLFLHTARVPETRRMTNASAAYFGLAILLRGKFHTLFRYNNKIVVTDQCEIKVI